MRKQLDLPLFDIEKLYGELKEKKIRVHKWFEEEYRELYEIKKRVTFEFKVIGMYRGDERWFPKPGGELYEGIWNDEVKADFIEAIRAQYWIEAQALNCDDMIFSYDIIEVEDIE